MGYSLKKQSHRKYAYFLFCVMVFDYLLFPLPIYAQSNTDASAEQCAPVVLAADTAVPINQSFVIENEAKHDLLKKASKIASSKLLGHSNDDKIKVRAALLNDDLYQAIENNTESAKVGSTSEKVISHGYHSMTAYTSEAAQTDASPCTTANGFNVCNHGVEDTIAANFLPFGTKVRAPELFGDRIFVVRDRMNSRYSERVDFWFKEKPAALRFGVKYAKIEVVKTD